MSNDNNHGHGLRPEIYQIMRTLGLVSHHSEILRIGDVAVSSALREWNDGQN